jgi:hypothetical protein
MKGESVSREAGLACLAYRGPAGSGGGFDAVVTASKSSEPIA